MKLFDILVGERILLARTPGTLTAAVSEALSLCQAGEEGGAPATVQEAASIASGQSGARVRANEQVILAATTPPTGDEVKAALVVASEPFSAPLPETSPDAVARVLLLVSVPGTVRTLRAQWFPALVRAFREEGVTERVVLAKHPHEILAIGSLMDTALRGRLLVEDVLTPVSFRVYPDTPLQEVVDLMVRREVHAVPVVGERYEVLGIITAGDALTELLPRTLAGDTPAEGSSLSALTARDVMTRSVMCVSEGQTLLEAANLMVNRDVEQLPVVREGELVGFVTRNMILKTLNAG
jgi:CBS domain-containing protein